MMDNGIIPANSLEYWSSLGRLDMVEKALCEDLDVNVQGQGGYTPLHAAAENGHLPVLLFLLERGAEVNLCMASGETPLDLAMAAGQQETAELLRQNGATTGVREGR